MSQNLTGLHGIVRGKTIELTESPGLPDGQAVSITLRPTAPVGEGLRQSAGGWADVADELDCWLEETRQSRKESRPEPLE